MLSPQISWDYVTHGLRQLIDDVRLQLRTTVWSLATGEQFILEYVGRRRERGTLDARGALPPVY